MAIAYPLEERPEKRRWRAVMEHIPLFPSLVLVALVGAILH